MPAIPYTLIVEIGATYTKRFVHKDSTGTVISTASKTGVFQILNKTTGAVVVNITTTPSADGSIVMNGADGTFDLTIAAAKTALMTSGAYEHAMEFTTPGTSPLFVERMIEGPVQIKSRRIV